MAFGQDEAVAAVPCGIVGTMVHHAAEIQRGEDVGA